MKRLFAFCVVSFFLVGIIISCGQKTETVKKYEWKMHSYVPDTVAFYKGYMLPLIEELKKRSNGQILITPYPANSIVAPSELLVATSEGVIECALGTTGYDTGIIPEAYAATNLPYGWADVYQPADFWYNNKEAWDIVDRAYMSKNVKLIALLNPDEPMTFLTMFPVNKASDLKGKLIRSSGNWALMLSNTGASQVNMPLGDVFESLEKGVIDGVFMAVSALNDFRWDEVVKYVMMPPIMVSGGADIIVNLDAFNELTPELQKIFVETTREMANTHLIPYTVAESSKTVKSAKAKGVEFITLPGSELEVMRKAALTMWKEIEEINPETARQISLIREYLDDKGSDYPGKELK